MPAPNALKVLSTLLSSRMITISLPKHIERRLVASIKRHNQFMADDPLDPKSDEDLGHALMACVESGLERDKLEQGLHATLDGRILTTSEYVAATITAQERAKRERRETHDRLVRLRAEDPIIDAMAREVFNTFNPHPDTQRDEDYEAVADEYRKAVERALKVRVEDLIFSWGGDTLTTLDGRTFQIRAFGPPDDRYFSGVELRDGVPIVTGPSFEGAGTIEIAKKRVEGYVLETMGSSS